VLPLVPREKRPLTKNGLLDASVDPRRIELWWTRWPDANVGLRTGEAFDALDIDGEVGRASLEAKAGPVSHTGPVSRTGRGEHWLYEVSHTANRAALLPKLDWRGVNGYIVAPPSVHPDGHNYMWEQGHGPRVQLPPVPDWLLSMLTHKEPRGPEGPIRVLSTNEFDRLAKVKGIVLDPYKLQAIQTDIVETARAMGYNPQPKGSRWVLNCIFHEGDNEASLTLYPRDNSFYCYGCEAWGDAMNLKDKRPGGRRAQR
jgi:hypothetical protein